MAEDGERPPDHVFAFEMALNEDEMVRLAAHLDPDRPIRRDGATVRGVFGPAAAPWSMTLRAGRERRFGPIRFPIADVTVAIACADEPTVADFLARFHLVFRKGGG
jgi:hypothetical protein